MALQVGSSAPDFTLVSSDKETVSLSDFRGKQNVVLMFFPLAFTGVCTKQLCTMRDALSDYNNLDAQVLGISVDSPFALAKFKEQEHYNFPLLSDFNRTVSAAYGAQYDEFVMGLKGVAKRAAFVIDKEGIVRYAEVLEDAGNLPNFNGVYAVLHGLNHNES